MILCVVPIGSSRTTVSPSVPKCIGSARTKIDAGHQEHSHLPGHASCWRKLSPPNLAPKFVCAQKVLAPKFFCAQKVLAPKFFCAQMSPKCRHMHNCFENVTFQVLLAPKFVCAQKLHFGSISAPENFGSEFEKFGFQFRLRLWLQFRLRLWNGFGRRFGRHFGRRFGSKCRSNFGGWSGLRHGIRAIRAT